MMGGWRGEEEETSDVLEVKKKKIQKENRVEGTFKEEEGGKQKEMVKQIFKQICVCVCVWGQKSGWKWGGGSFSQACLRQCDMAHAINSGSAERPCLAICSGSGAFAGVGVTSTPTAPRQPPHLLTVRHTHTHPQTQNQTPPHPCRPRLTDTRPGPRAFP